MKIYTLSNSVVYNNSLKNLIPDGNLPIYPYKYTITSDQGTILVSTIGILPTKTNPNRIGTFKIGGTCTSGALNITIYDHYPLQFEDVVYGTFTFNNEIYSTMNIVTFLPQSYPFTELTLTIQVPGSITDETPFYLDILINDSSIDNAICGSNNPQLNLCTGTYNAFYICIFDDTDKFYNTTPDTYGNLFNINISRKDLFSNGQFTGNEITYTISPGESSISALPVAFFLRYIGNTSFTTTCTVIIINKISQVLNIFNNYLNIEKQYTYDTIYGIKAPVFSEPCYTTFELYKYSSDIANFVYDVEKSSNVNITTFKCP
jgi:hypothetical protein